MRCLGILLLLLGLGTEPLFATEPAQSEGAPADRDLAASHYESGKAAFNEGRWSTALLEFKLSYDLSHEPILLADLSVVAEKMGDHVRAIEYAKAFLVAAPADTPKDALLEAEARIRRLSSPQASAGVHLEQQKKSDVAKKSPIPYVLLGVGGAALLGSLTTAAVAKALSNRVESVPITAMDLESANQEGSRLNQSSGALLGIGLCLAVSGSIWLIVNRTVPHGGQQSTP